jgi:hypothetical protein
MTEDRQTRGGRWRTGQATSPAGTRAQIAGRLACGHYAERGDRIVHRGNGWLCADCATVTTARRR